MLGPCSGTSEVVLTRSFSTCFAEMMIWLGVPKNGECHKNAIFCCPFFFGILPSGSYSKMRFTGGASRMQVLQVHGSDQIERYIEFPNEVYRDNRFWVPADRHHMMSLLTGQKEAGPHWTVQPFLVEEGGRILATITAVVDDLYNRHWKERAGHLLFFEALPDCEEAANALFRDACAWLQ